MEKIKKFIVSERSRHMKKGYELLNDPFLNKGTAFSMEERAELGLIGLLPPTEQTIEVQAQQVYGNFQAKPNVSEKRHYLMNIFSRNRTLFYYVFKQHIAEFMPIIYDPGIAESIREYSQFFITPQNAAYLSVEHPEQIEESLKNTAMGRDIELIVVTDAEAILGIGDWGTNGVGISTGKLMVYTGAAGIDPAKVLPVVIDAGTNRQSLLDDPLYFGLRHKRVDDDTYYAFVDKFVKQVESMFPRLYLHFEDFGRGHAAVLLKKYVDTYPSSTTTSKERASSPCRRPRRPGHYRRKTGRPALHVLWCRHGRLRHCQTNLSGNARSGLSEDDAKSRFYLVDKQGLLFDDMTDLTPEQKPFARKRSEFENAASLTTLEAAVKAVHPTILVGTSTRSGAFTEAVVKEMASQAARPMIFPLSNPTELAEAKAEDLIRWTDGKALVATGIPTDPVTYNGVTYDIGQANNASSTPVSDSASSPQGQNS